MLFSFIIRRRNEINIKRPLSKTWRKNMTIDQLTFPSSKTIILLQCRTVFILCAMVITVQSSKHSWIVCWISESVAVSMLAVASSKIRIFKQKGQVTHCQNNTFAVFFLYFFFDQNTKCPVYVSRVCFNRIDYTLGRINSTINERLCN